MKTHRIDRLGRGRLIGLIIAALLALTLVGIGVYGLLTGPGNGTDNTSSSGTDPENRSSAETPSPSAEPTISPVPQSDDPEVFARAVAERIFTWETTSGLMPLDYTAAVLEVGDPSGTEQAGLASDLESYYPTREAWIDLRTYSTTQHLSIDETYVPEAWQDAVDQAREGQLVPGATAITVEGTRHREGIWNQEPVTSEHEVAFTLFLACPEEDPCAVLRLSELDNPLH